jgi:hypothetical protein
LITTIGGEFTWQKLKELTKGPDLNPDTEKLEVKEEEE